MADEERVSFEKNLASAEVAETFLTEKEKLILKRYTDIYNRRIALCNGEETHEAVERLSKEVFVEVPGSLKALHKWARIQEELRLAGEG